MSGFFLTPMTRFYVETLQYMKNTCGQTKDTENSAGEKPVVGGFAETVQSKLTLGEQEFQGVSADAAKRAGERDEAAVRAMFMEAYKLYIYQKIAGIPMNASQRWDAVSVNISEEGFAAMKDDPSYEKWVLDTLRNDFSYYNPWSSYCGGSYRSYYFGATKEEYRGESYSMGFRNDSRRKDSSRKKKEKSFWEKRAERHKLYMDLAQKAWYRRESERKYQERIAFGRKEVSSAILKQQAIERATGEHVELDANPSVLSEAATDFAQGYVFFKIPSALVNPKPKSAK